jgi:molybdopterin-guanine dinucleotide biosynthesis protein A
MLGPVGESSQPPVGVILAGGQGRRIGGQKALIELAGRPLIEWIAAAAGQAFPEVWAVAKADTELPELPGVVVVREPPEPSHPVVGLVTALRAARGRPVVVAAADMPFVGVQTLRVLGARQPGRTLITAHGGQLQPLLARYEPADLPALEAAAGAARAPLRAVVAGLHPALLEVADRRELFNVNTPEDLRHAEAIVAGEGKPAGERYPNVKS